MLSLIVPLYNEGDEVESLLRHVRALHGFDDVILIDASDDAAAKARYASLAQQWQSPRLRFLQSDMHGRALQMNRAAATARGDALVFLHCDTRLPVDAAALIEDCFARGFVWGRFDVAFDSHRPLLRCVQMMINLRSRMRRLATGDQAIFIARDAFESRGGFAEIALMEDIDLSARMKPHKPALIRRPVTTSARRWRQHGAVKTILLMWLLRLGFQLGVKPARLAAWYVDAR